ncbi:heteromeric transposase endonuclease subunit TnsA [Paucidesulfovibrio longus]|uniref:heteromeric transposase endonuclease subunit TnsA n=1 Tax=Paucidesulfovibrio longus TaxID=889 RepID=UPI0003B6E48D|nr:heteromeric transposase endonuclease subunit TnsA [Paucidesulfovibrio longus]
MSRDKHTNADLKFARWIKEGRGSGRGSDYKPWLTVRDVPSKGRSHRVFGHKSQRTHHLLSDLELAVFLFLEWHPRSTDIREQFPLPLKATLAAAEGAGIRHPAVSGVPQYMTTDFRVSTSDSDQPEFALQAKYQSEFAFPRVVEKLELERRYWASQNIPWFIITEKDLPAGIINNIKWLYPTQGDHIPTMELHERLSFYTESFQSNPKLTVISLAKKLDIAYHLTPGESLLEIRQLLAQRFFIFDIRIPHIKLTAAHLAPMKIMSMPGGRNVSSE